MRSRICEEQRALPAYEKPPAWRVDVYFLCTLLLPEFAVEGAVLDRFGDVGKVNFVTTVEVGDRAGDTQDFVVCPKKPHGHGFITTKNRYKIIVCRVALFAPPLRVDPQNSP